MAIVGPLLAGPIGCGTTRKPQTDELLMQQRADTRAAYDRTTSERYETMLERVAAELDDYGRHHIEKEPTIDYLVISGGGDFGAFGAGFLKGWLRVPKAHELARPRFNIVTGVSTGALIAPFAYLGDEESADRVVELYRNPKPDWVKERWPLFFLPSNLSFAEVPGLEREVKSCYSKDLIDQIANDDNFGRSLVVNTTNLDDASPHVFYMVPEARRARETGDYERFRTILLASSGIPGAFPYREIDGQMHVDGAVTGNMVFGARIPEDRRIVGLWQSMYPGVTMPKLRYWVIFNNQLQAPPRVVPARWFDIITRSVDVAARSASLVQLRELFMLVDVARYKRHADVEVRYIAIPDDWRPKQEGQFLKETMNDLANLGERLGADPNSWLTEAPMQ